MLNWIALNRTNYLHKMDLALNNLERLICHKTQQTKPNVQGCGNDYVLIKWCFVAENLIYEMVFFVLQNLLGNEISWNQYHW